MSEKKETGMSENGKKSLTDAVMETMETSFLAGFPKGFMYPPFRPKGAVYSPARYRFLSMKGMQ